MVDVPRLYPKLVGVPKCVVGELVEEVEVSGWKGRDRLVIEDPPCFRPGQVYVLVEHRKKKFSGEVEEIRNVVAWERVMELWRFIEDWPVGMVFRPRYLWAKLIELHGLDCDIESFNGGRWRSRAYMPLYYFPMKILEGKGVVWFGHDAIQRVAVLRDDGIEVVR
jgi:hypothetical protein